MSHDHDGAGPVGRGLDLAAELAHAAVTRGAPPARLLVRLAMRPPLVPDALSPARAVHDVSVRARRAGDRSAAALSELIGSMLDEQVPKIADAVLARLDLTETARRRIDLAQLTSEVIDEIDLPSIIRESTSGVASDVVAGARASAATADEAVARFLSRRRGRRRDPRAGEEST